jgi:invasion protein IalB
MSDTTTDTPEGSYALRSSRGAMLALKVLVPVLIFFAGAATTLLVQRFVLGNGADELRVITFDDWRVVCPPMSEEERNCSLTSEVVPGQVQLVLEDPTLGSRLRVIVPHGVFLDPGLGFSVGAQPLAIYQYETCMPVGCFAHVPLDTAMLGHLRENMNGDVVVVPAAGSPVTVPYSLNGFGAGYDALVEEQARRNSMWNFLRG